MKALLLVRVSTQSQDFQAQQKELEDYASKMGFNQLKIVADKESAIKLSEEDRHGLNEMKTYLESNPDCKNVFVWEISRLARTEKVLQSIKEWLISRKINLHILSENITLLDKDGNETAAGGLLFSLFGHLASQEMKIKKQRMNRGKAEAAKKGKFTGGGIVKYGYTVNSDNYVVINPEEADVVKMVFELYASNKYSVTSLVTELKERGYNFTWDRLRYMLSDESYIGGCDEKNKLVHTHPTIIDEELFNKVQSIKAANYTEKSKATVHKKLALKILKCWKCGASYSFNNSMQYECNHRKYYKRFNCDRCDGVSINSDVMDDILEVVAKEEYGQYLVNLNNTTLKEVNDKIELMNKKIEVANGELVKNKVKKDKLADLYVDGDITEAKYNAKKAELKAAEDNSKANIKTFKKEIERLNSSIEDINAEEDWQKESRELWILIQTESIKDISKVREMIQNHIKVAYINQFTYKNRDMKVVCVIGNSGKLYTYLYDFRDRTDKCRIIGISGSGSSYISDGSDGYYPVGITCDYLRSIGNSTDLKEIRKIIKPFIDIVKSK